VSLAHAVQDRAARLVGDPDGDHTIEKDRGGESHDQRPVRPEERARRHAVPVALREPDAVRAGRREPLDPQLERGAPRARPEVDFRSANGAIGAHAGTNGEVASAEASSQIRLYQTFPGPQ